MFIHAVADQAQRQAGDDGGALEQPDKPVPAGEGSTSTSGYAPSRPIKTYSSMNDAMPRLFRLCRPPGPRNPAAPAMTSRSGAYAGCTRAPMPRAAALGIAFDDDGQFVEPSIGAVAQQVMQSSTRAAPARAPDDRRMHRA